MSLLSRLSASSSQAYQGRHVRGQPVADQVSRLHPERKSGVDMQELSARLGALATSPDPGLRATAGILQRRLTQDTEGPRDVENILNTLGSQSTQLQPRVEHPAPLDPTLLEPAAGEAAGFSPGTALFMAGYGHTDAGVRAPDRAIADQEYAALMAAQHQPVPPHQPPSA